MLILLGEAGMGKTHVLCQAYKQNEAQTPNGCIYIDLARYGSHHLAEITQKLFEGDEFRAYRAGGELTLYLDSYDQILADDRKFDQWLIRQLKRHVTHPERFFLRIASRYGGWTNGLEDNLKDLWPNHSHSHDIVDDIVILKLCPLQRKDVLEAAYTCLPDAEQFVQEIEQRGIEPLASRPITLNFLLDTWKNEHTLSDSQLEAYKQGLLRLCEIERSKRGFSLTASQCLTIASRLAAASLLCGHSEIWIGRETDTPKEHINLYDLIGQEKTDTGPLKVGKNALEETISVTGLFTNLAPDRLAFAHHSFAEFLAARYLHRAEIDTTRKLALLRVNDGVGIVPRLRGTAVWLAHMEPEVCASLLNEEPALLLQLDAKALDEPLRKDLVDALLQQVAADRLFPHDLPWQSLRNLDHPGLAQQLRPWIEGQEQPYGHVRARELAILLAGACKAMDLSAALLPIALNADEESQLRLAATRAVLDIGEEASVRQLQALALGQGGPDPDLRLRRLAMAGLWPDHLSAQQWFDGLETVLHHHSLFTELEEMIYSGDFRATLRVEHMPVALDWVRRHIPTVSADYAARQLASAILQRALQWLEQPEVLEACAHTVAALATQYQPLFAEDEINADNPLNRPEIRRRLLLRLLALIEPGQAQDLVMSHPPLARAEDIGWLLDRIEQGLPRHEDRTAAELIRWLRLPHDVPVSVVNRRLERCGIAAARPDLILRKALSLLLTHPMRLKAPWVRKSRQRRLAEQERQQAMQALARIHNERIQTALLSSEQGDWSSWPTLAMELARQPGSPSYDIPRALYKKPVWQESDEQLQKRIQQAALHYLMHAPAPAVERLYRETQTIADLAASFACELLYHTAPALLDDLQPEHWAKWMDVLLVGLHHSEPWENQLLSRAASAAPEATLAAAIRLLDHRWRNAQEFSSLSVLDSIWSPELAGHLLVLLDQPELDLKARKAILKQLLRHKEPRTQRWALAIERDSTDNNLREMAAALLFALDTKDSWPRLEALLEQEADFAKRLILQAAHEHVIDLDGLAEDELATLYIWLETHFPAAEDPQHAGVYTPTVRDSVAELRSNVLTRLREAGTRQAVQALERIKSTLPDRAWLQWHYLQGLEHARRVSWQPPKWNELLEQLQNPDSRLIRSADDLLQAVIDSLHRLQKQLQGPTPLAPFLWDEHSTPKPEIRLSEFVKYHLDADLNRRGVLINREVEVSNWPGHGRGESLDLLVQCLSADKKRLNVVIEVKRCQNPKLLDSLRSQLADRYLIDEEHRHGVYLIGWYGLGVEGCAWQRSELEEKLRSEAKAVSEKHIEVVVLDISLKARPS
ncbi:MAG: hypothetical protein NZ524_11120 [Thiobacillaceae bacterium]|nr:hypothetical protein [Thiobacillaceae bacterium]